jgi:hypothetical protein
MMLREYRIIVHNWHRVFAFQMDVDLKPQQNLTDTLFVDVEKVDSTL